MATISTHIDIEKHHKILNSVFTLRLPDNNYDYHLPKITRIFKSLDLHVAAEMRDSDESGIYCRVIVHSSELLPEKILFLLTVNGYYIYGAFYRVQTAGTLRACYFPEDDID